MIITVTASASLSIEPKGGKHEEELSLLRWLSSARCPFRAATRRNNRQGTLAGGAIGAGGGALIGSALTGGSAGGAIAGGIIGAGTGALIGNAVTAPRRHCARWGYDYQRQSRTAAPGTDQSTLRAPWLGFPPWRAPLTPRARLRPRDMIRTVPGQPARCSLRGFAQLWRAAAAMAGPNCLILHYTGMPTGEAALKTLTDPASEVSAHYLVWEDGAIDQLVAESDRAWHAGRGSWKGESDLNSASIGIEIVNPGHDGGSPPFPERQIEATIALAQDICARWAIAPERVLAHSDIAPARKRDPGEVFPWGALWRSGVGHWTEPAPLIGPPLFAHEEEGPPVRAMQAMLALYGYGRRDHRGLRPSDPAGGRSLPAPLPAGTGRRRGGRFDRSDAEGADRRADRRRLGAELPAARADRGATCLCAYFSACAGMTPVAKATAAAWVKFMQCNLWRAASRWVFTLPNAKPRISAISW